MRCASSCSELGMLSLMSIRKLWPDQLQLLILVYNDSNQPASTDDIGWAATMPASSHVKINHHTEG